MNRPFAIHTLRRRKAIAWIAVAAMLFGAVSPALAAALFADHPDILRRMLAIPAAPQPAAPHATAADDDGCPHEAAAPADDELSFHAHHDAGAGPGQNTEHAAHGIFCSFCLTASATLALPAAAPAVVSAAPAIIPPSSAHEREPDAPRFAGCRSRAPPCP